jgi:hypothetical protein
MNPAATDATPLCGESRGELFGTAVTAGFHNPTVRETKMRAGSHSPDEGERDRDAAQPGEDAQSLPLGVRLGKHRPLAQDASHSFAWCVRFITFA